MSDLHTTSVEAFTEATSGYTGPPVIITGWTVATAAVCPASVTSDTPFAWNPSTIRRTLALEIARLVHDQHLDLSVATVQAVTELARAQTPGRARVTAGEWLAQSAPAERAMAAAGATELAAKVLTALAALPGTVTWGPSWWWRHPSNRIHLHARAWVTVTAPDGQRTHITVERGPVVGAPGVRAAHDTALGAMLATGCLPDACAVIRPDSGRHAFFDPATATVAALRLACVAARALVTRAAGGSPPTNPGVHCRWCPNLSSCGPGKGHLTPAEEDEEEF